MKDFKGEEEKRKRKTAIKRGGSKSRLFTLRKMVATEIPPWGFMQSE